MQWEDARRSDNVEDDRGGGGGGGFGIPIGGGGLGIGAVIILTLIGFATGIDPRILIGGAEQVTNHGQGYQQTYNQNSAQPYNQPRQRQAQQDQSAPKDQTADFVAAILGQTEDVWSQILPAQKGVNYVPPKLVLYSGMTRSGCGQAQSAMGPFYCPVDRKVYLDLSFFNDMKRKLGGGGDFAYAYVIAHEIGHHVQNLLGILPKVHQAQQQGDEEQSNALSVKLELQADCFAGVWANHADETKHILEQGDVESALRAASAVGDDTLQRRTQGYVVPDSFTHGTSAERVAWFKRGFAGGSIQSCDTFASPM